MQNPEHERAQALAAEAEMLLAKGKRREARTKYAEAAVYERKALALVDLEKYRTRGIIAVSAASLLYKAKELTEAEQLLYCFLADTTYLPPHREQFKELLESVRDEQVLPSGTVYSGQEIWISLRGGTIGSGTAPFDLALTKSAEIKNLVLRTAECVAKKPLRTKGAPSGDIQSLVQARATQPSTGSYRFAIRLVEPDQRELFTEQAGVSGKSVSAEDVSRMLFGFIKAASSNSPKALETLRALVPDPDYRRTLVRLVRNLVPSRQEGLGEVELTRVAGAEKGGPEPEREAVLLLPGVRAHLGEVLKAENPPPPEEKEAELRGVLRAVHLDEHWLVLVDERGEEQKCITRDDVLDDVVGPMVNRKVVVRGSWRQTAGTKRFLLREIDLHLDDSGTR